MKYGNLTSTEIRQALNKLGGEEGVRAFVRDDSDIKISPTTTIIKMTEIIVGIDDPAKSQKPFTILHAAAAYFKANRFSETTTVREERIVWKTTLRELGLSSRSRRNSMVSLQDVQKAFRCLGLKTCSLELLARLRAAYHNQPEDEFINVPVNGFGAVMLLGHSKGYGLIIDRKPLHQDSLVKLDSDWVFLR